MKIKELEIVAKTDEVAKQILETRRVKNKEKNKKFQKKKIIDKEIRKWQYELNQSAEEIMKNRIEEY